MGEARKILLLGAGGHCISVLDSLLALNIYQEVGIIDRVAQKHLTMGVPVVGTDEDLYLLHSDRGYTDAFISVGSIGDSSLRRKLYDKIKRIGFNIPNIIDNTSVVSNNATLKEGIYVGKNAVVNAYANIGNLSIINTGSIVEHECIIDEFVHIAPRSTICGNVRINKDTHIGAGSVIKQGVKIGANTIIGMGSVVTTNIRDNIIAYGNPCKEVKKHE